MKFNNITKVKAVTQDKNETRLRYSDIVYVSDFYTVSVLNSLLIRVMKRVFVCTNDTVIIAQRMYDIFS